MQSIIVARTAEKERYDVDNGRWYCEWRVRELHDQERYELFHKYRLNLHDVNKPYILEGRRMDVDSETGQHTIYDASQWPDGWALYGFGNTIRLTIRELIGDTSFHEAISLCDEHKAEVERSNALMKLYIEKRNIGVLLSPMPYPHSDIAVFQEEYQNRYENELRSRRLWKKARDGKVKQEVIDEIRKPIVDECKAKAKELRDRLAVVNREIGELEMS